MLLTGSGVYPCVVKSKAGVIRWHPKARAQTPWMSTLLIPAMVPHGRFDPDTKQLLLVGISLPNSLFMGQVNFSMDIKIFFLFCFKDYVLFSRNCYHL